MTGIAKRLPLFPIVFAVLFPVAVCAESDRSDSRLADEAGYIAVDLSEASSVNGKTLMIAAYGIILGVLVLYGFSLVLRERAVAQRAESLKKQLEKKGGGGLV